MDQYLDAKSVAQVDFEGDSDIAQVPAWRGSVADLNASLGSSFVALPDAGAEPSLRFAPFDHAGGYPELGSLIASYRKSTAAGGRLPIFRVYQQTPSPNSDETIKRNAETKWCVGDCERNEAIVLAGGQPALVMWEPRRGVLSVSWVQRNSGDMYTSMQIFVEAPFDTDLESVVQIADELSKLG